MTDLQHDTYADAEEIKSDPWGLFDRDNRNHAKKQDLILDATAAEPGDRVLEVGCGHGLHARRYVEEFDYLGVDISPSLIASAMDIAPEGTYRVGDAMDLSIQPDAYDAVVGTAILHHLPDVHDALAEWRRVTKPGGSITLCEPNYLFPKEFLSTHLKPEEKHKYQMAPWRLRTVLREFHCRDWQLEPCIYTPPWPEAAHALYDHLDAVGASVSGLRWLSQMFLIHIDV